MDIRKKLNDLKDKKNKKKNEYRIKPNSLLFLEILNFISQIKYLEKRLNDLEYYDTFEYYMTEMEQSPLRYTSTGPLIATWRPLKHMTEDSIIEESSKNFIKKNSIHF